jgi:putative membrane protein
MAWSAHRAFRFPREFTDQLYARPVRMRDGPCLLAAYCRKRLVDARGAGAVHLMAKLAEGRARVEERGRKHYSQKSVPVGFGFADERPVLYRDSGAVDRRLYHRPMPTIMNANINSRSMRCLALAALICAIAPTSAIAHGGKPHGPGDLWKTWGWEPVVVVSLALSGLLYYRGIRRLWRESAPGAGIRKWEAAAFAGGWFALFIALVSPLHPLGRVLFSAHMTQHEILMLVAAPLLVLGRPLIPYLWALPIEWRRKLGQAGKARWIQGSWRALTNPLVAWAVHAFALWIWHAPALFQATIDNEFIHTLQHLSFLVSALFFWWSLAHSRRSLMRYGAAVLYVFTTSIHSGVLGALITFASTLWYPAYAATTSAWGLTSLEDQQLGGLIMWIPAGLVYIAAGLALFAGWMRESERALTRKKIGSAPGGDEVNFALLKEIRDGE